MRRPSQTAVYVGSDASTAMHRLALPLDVNAKSTTDCCPKSVYTFRTRRGVLGRPRASPSAEILGDTRARSEKPSGGRQSQLRIPSLTPSQTSLAFGELRPGRLRRPPRFRRASDDAKSVSPKRRSREGGPRRTESRRRSWREAPPRRPPALKRRRSHRQFRRRREGGPPQFLQLARGPAIAETATSNDLTRILPVNSRV